VGAIVGPYARAAPRRGAGRKRPCRQFRRVKKTRLEKGAKANHLTYLGDARVGAGANIGAGTITCNYDGFDKHQTDIGAGAFIGSDTALVAPVRSVTVRSPEPVRRHQGCGGRRARRRTRGAEGNSGLGGEIPYTEESGKGREIEG